MQKSNLKFIFLCGLLVAALLVERAQIDGAIFLHHILLCLFILAAASLARMQAKAGSNHAEKDNEALLAQK
ncbi:MAG: hypothetical protein R3B47_08195 [Bacteroidia bacterium]